MHLVTLLLGLAKDSTQRPYLLQGALASLDLPDHRSQGHLAQQPGSAAEPSLALGPTPNYKHLGSPNTYVGAVDSLL